MEKTNKNPMTEIEQLAATITEGTKSTLRDILSEAVSNYLREEVLNEDDDDDVEETQDAKSSDVPEFEETSDDAESDDADDVIEEPEKADEENEESEGDEWADFEDYKIGDDEGSEQYDFTNETNPETLIKVFKLMKNDDQVSVVKDGDKVSIKDNEADTEYVIELNGDTDNFENNDLTMTESLGYTDNYQDKDPIEGLSMDNATPKNTKDWHKGVPTGTNKPWAGKGKNEPFGKKTEKVFEITLNDEVEVENEEEPIEENVTTSKYQQRRMVKTMAPENAYVQDLYRLCRQIDPQDLQM